MILSLIGAALLCYFVFYLICLYFLDCDVQLAFYEKFGHKISRLQGKVVFVTGASSGIGEYTAIALAKNGVKLVLSARREVELERVKKICVEKSAGKLTTDDVLVLPMDMIDVSSHQKHFDAALQHFGHVDVLFNNAGRSQRAYWENVELAVDKELFDLNLFSGLNLARIFLRYFYSRGEGHIAVCSSIAGIMSLPLSPTYTGSKHALHGYYNALRTEKLKSDLNLVVTIVCPGPTFTNFLENSLTGKQGETYGVSMKKTDKRMTAERCGELCALALANKTNESWIFIAPMLLLTYFWVYFPVTRDLVLRLIGPARLFVFRDSKKPGLEVVQILDYFDKVEL